MFFLNDFPASGVLNCSAEGFGYPPSFSGAFLYLLKDHCYSQQIISLLSKGLKMQVTRLAETPLELIYSDYISAE